MQYLCQFYLLTIYVTLVNISATAKMYDFFANKIKVSKKYNILENINVKKRQIIDSVKVWKL